MKENNSLTYQAQQRILDILHGGDAVIDATCGNGHDTVFLSKHVGESGKVFSFDIQYAAIDSAKAMLNTKSVNNTKFFHACHSQMYDYIPDEFIGKIKVIMFNLGYLPGSDKSIVTELGTTIKALNVSCQMLSQTGLISIVAYPGHVGGDVETRGVMNWLQSLEKNLFEYEIIESNESSCVTPKLFFLSKV